MEGAVSASDWFKGITLSVLASVIGGASKLAIRKSWLMEAEMRGEDRADEGQGIHLEDPMILNCRDPCHSDPLLADETASLEERSHNSEEQQEQQRQEQQQEEEQQVQQQQQPTLFLPYFLRILGMIGMSLLNPICCVLAMNYASPSILAPFSGLTLVWVILFSYPAVGEQPSASQVVAALFILTGEVVVAIFGDHTNDAGVTVEDVRQSYSDKWFLCYFAAVAVYITVLSYWMAFSKKPLLRRFAWGVSGGAITGLQNFLKDTLTIYKATKAGNEPLPWFFPLFIFLAAATAFVGLLILTACMKRYDATYSAATFVGSFVVSASIMSAIHYDTFAGLEDLIDYILYPFGLVILMIGVFILVRDTNETIELLQDAPNDVDPANEDPDDIEDNQPEWFEMESTTLIPKHRSLHQRIRNRPQFTNGLIQVVTSSWSFLRNYGSQLIRGVPARRREPEPPKHGDFHTYYNTMDTCSTTSDSSCGQSSNDSLD